MKPSITTGNSLAQWLNQPRPDALRGSRVNAEPVGKADTASPLQQGSALGERVGRLGQATVQMAQTFLGDFARTLFGDAAEGMQVQFDAFDLSASSSAGAALLQRGDGLSAAAFELQDSSSFTGRGTLTTADGRTFEFEVEVRYQAVQQATYASHGDEAATTDSASGWRSLFDGTAADLLRHLSAEPARQPFALQGAATDAPFGLLGDMALQLLDLPGGPRYVDLPALLQSRPEQPGLRVKA
ncbi:hypothetical protein N8I74_16290 [Chitiniphilus purpureus]|uniref:DUF5610 domain-containing protein n=1 Tax=Chitiniphilus purpureus TaxID=2981137 RepID=A0ABY6DME4_9NEIS|nr:hypothetical protein [Chitiniphilus sp. CD1]UXY14858.1 hypothetical protein N8I74_16290 [Chitiniphilus sp. CD1]